MNKYKTSLDEDIKLIRLKYQNLIKDLTDKSLSKKDIAIINKNINNVMPIINVINNINQLKITKDENTKLLDENNDEDIVNLVNEENQKINIKIDEFKSNAKILITKYHTNISQKKEDVIFEIRAGTGGDEASIFAFELWQMYLKFFDKMKWKYQILSYSSTNRKSIRELILRVSGTNIYEYIKYESGVHRVQRIPVTESQGRIHTSVCTVVVLHAEIRKKNVH
jgi:peptide chain release factor 1